jgi:UDP-glucose 4-epimerase
VVAAFIKRILAGQPVTVYGDGSQVRDFVYVEDLCEGIVAALDRDVDGVIQLGSGRPVSVDALLEELGRVVAPLRIERLAAPPNDGEIRATWCDIAKARKCLGFEPRTSLAEGLARTWDWFRQRGSDLSS